MVGCQSVPKDYTDRGRMILEGIMRCEQWKAVSFYQRRCERDAKYKVTRLVLFHDAEPEESTQNLCQYCARKHIKMRKDVDAGLIYNPPEHYKTYPRISKM